MLIPSTVLVSKCCHAIILMDDMEYQCSNCLDRCESDGIIGDLAAPKAERARLEREVIEAAKQWHEMRLMQAGTSLSRRRLMEAVDALAEFEAKQK